MINNNVHIHLCIIITYCWMTIIRKNHHYVESKEFGCRNNIGRSLPSFSTRSRRSKVGFIVPFVPTYSRYHEKQQQQGENKNFILQCENNDWNDNNNYYPSFQQKTEKFRSKWHTKFHMAGGIVYKKSVLSNIEFQTIQSELQQLSFTLKDEKSSSVAKLRKGAQLPYDSPIVQILADTNGSIYRIINDIAFSNHPTNQNNNHTMILSTFIPVEVRYCITSFKIEPKKKNNGVFFFFNHVLHYYYVYHYCCHIMI